MKRFFLFIAVLTIFTNCKNEKDSTQAVDKQEIKQTTNENFNIKNAADYSADFIKGLKEQNLSEVTLDGNKIIIDGQEITFPEYPAFGKPIILSGKKDKLTITLTINRKNQTTINYTIAMMETGNGLTKYEGEASVSPTFYLGLESDESSLSKLMYPVDEYLAEEGDCFTAIRLGKEDESGKMLLGKLIKNCNGEIRNINLDDFPTLVEEKF